MLPPSGHFGQFRNFKESTLNQAKTQPNNVMHFKQKSDLLQFLSTSVKYVLRVVNMVANRPFGTISKFQKSRLNQTKTQPINVFPAKVLHVASTGFPHNLSHKIQGVFKEILPKIKDQFFRNGITLTLSPLHCRACRACRPLHKMHFSLDRQLLNLHAQQSVFNLPNRPFRVVYLLFLWPSLDHMTTIISANQKMF